jgi:hypothetical protein
MVGSDCFRDNQPAFPLNGRCLTRCGRSRASAMESANDWIVALRDYRLLPSNFFTLSASISIPSTHRALIAAIFAPVFGSVPIAND